MNSKTPSENTECKVMVALATLNQMVNYIGIDHYKSIEKVFVIVDETVKDTKKSYIFNHNRWYKALEKAVNTQINKQSGRKVSIVELKVNIHTHAKCGELTDKLKDVLENSKDDLDIKSEQIIWNLTGGQRHTMMACQKLMLERLREYKVKDEMIYLDGDHGVIYRQGYDQQGYLTDIKKGNEKVECYRFDGDLDLALELAGFTMVKKNIGTNLDNINLLGPNNKGKKFDQIKDIVKKKTGKPYLTNGEIIKFYEAYIKEENEELRKACIVSNKNNETYDKVEKELNRDGIIIEELVKKLEGIHKTKAFGYLLEYMTLYQVYETLAGCEGIKGVYHSVNVYREKSDKKSSYCEFDIVLMTTKGQLLVIECKSGIMPGDTGKGRQFTVYATNGVYGTPILITPLIEGDMKENKKILQDESYQYVKKSTYTAQRINLNFWYLDKIKKELTDYLKEREVK